MNVTPGFTRLAVHGHCIVVFDSIAFVFCVLLCWIVIFQIPFIHHGTQISNSSVATCTQNGTWSYTLECKQSGRGGGGIRIGLLEVSYYISLILSFVFVFLLSCFCLVLTLVARACFYSVHDYYHQCSPLSANRVDLGVFFSSPHNFLCFTPPRRILPKADPWSA